MNIVFRAISAIGVVLIVCLVALTDHEQMFLDVKWTDVGGLVITFIGFLFGFYTYFEWQKNKRKEDAYLSAKRYVVAIEEVEEHLHELDYQFSHICPAAGLVVESGDVSINRIQHLYSVLEYLYQARRNMYRCHRELQFWNVSLKDEFLGRHKDINRVLDSISVVSSSLCSQLAIFIQSEMENTSEVIHQKEIFDGLHEKIKRQTSNRIGEGFKSMFTFSDK